MSDFSKLVFEISWEVVNKVGGIHTVVRTKASSTVDELHNSYFMIGPYNPKDAISEVEIRNGNNYEMELVLNDMKLNGVKVYTGNWLIPGNPFVILFDINSAHSHLDNWRNELFRTNSISVNPFDKELSESLMFGGLVAWFLTELRKKLKKQVTMLAQFHEWNASLGLIFLRSWDIDIGLIFTTHATLMGRHLSAGGCDLYNNLRNFNCDYEAGRRGIYSQYCIERCAAHRAHVFTAVSNITAEEASAFLNRYPDVITPNGIYIKDHVALHEFQNLHVVCKEIIHDFIRGHFFGSYYFDLDKVVYLFNAGRYEYSNKGVDVLLEATARLNHILKAKNMDITVVVFLIFNSNTNNYNIESLKSQAMVRQLKQTVGKIQESIGERIFSSVVIGKIPETKDLLETKELIELKKFVQSCRTGNSLPPIVTHNMIDDEKDPILSTLRRLKLFNSPDDKVKIVFHPKFLTSTSPLFPIDYESFVRGCHLGIFPSYYEPWGYTPAECMNLGIPSLTTNLSGFGQFMEENIKHPTDYGIYIIDRRNKNVDESINQLTHYMYDFCKQNRRERIMQRNRCERLCEILDWKRLSMYYAKARQLAVERTHPDRIIQFPIIDEERLRIKKFERSLSMCSSSRSDASSEDEYPHLWGTTNRDTSFDGFS